MKSLIVGFCKKQLTVSVMAFGCQISFVAMTKTKYQEAPPKEEPHYNKAD